MTEIISELNHLIHRLKYYDDKKSKRDWIEQLENWSEELTDVEENAHDDCCSRDDLNEKNEEIEKLQEHIEELEKEIQTRGPNFYGQPLPKILPDNVFRLHEVPF